MQLAAGNTGGLGCGCGEGSKAPRAEHAEGDLGKFRAVCCCVSGRVGLRRCVSQCGKLPLSYGKGAFFFSFVRGYVFCDGSVA